uniref:Uncharacterized protein n=1 Tax=Rousettus aegyptiacus TaxID=9407 RepID=A0A7J8D6R1_ROUAE|nr:hypothetical protein HJG63_008777 [Rousettus aegyptiacus]
MTRFVSPNSSCEFHTLSYVCWAQTQTPIFSKHLQLSGPQTVQLFPETYSSLVFLSAHITLPGNAECRVLNTLSLCLSRSSSLSLSLLLRLFPSPSSLQSIVFLTKPFLDVSLLHLHCLPSYVLDCRHHLSFPVHIATRIPSVTHRPDECQALEVSQGEVPISLEQFYIGCSVSPSG